MTEITPLEIWESMTNTLIKQVLTYTPFEIYTIRTIKVFGSRIIEYGKNRGNVYIIISILENLNELKNRRLNKLADGLEKFILKSDRFVDPVKLARAKEILELKRAMNDKYHLIIDNLDSSEQEKGNLRTVVRYAKNIMNFDGERGFPNHHFVRFIDSIDYLERENKYIGQEIFDYLFEEKLLNEEDCAEAVSTLNNAKEFVQLFNRLMSVYKNKLSPEDEEQFNTYLNFSLSIIKYKKEGCDNNVYSGYLKAAKALRGTIQNGTRYSIFVVAIEKYLSEKGYVSEKDFDDVDVD